MEARLGSYGAADHINLSDRETDHDTDSNDVPFRDEEIIKARKEVIDNYNERDDYEVLEEEDVLRALRVADEEEDYKLINELVEEHRPPPTLLDSAEIDYESGEESIEAFLDDNDFDYPAISVHFIDGAYIKDAEEVLDSIFYEKLGYNPDEMDEELSNKEARKVIREVEEEKRNFVESYFDQLHSLLDSSIVADENVLVCHPGLIERNEVLTTYADEVHYKELIDAFSNSEAVPDFSGKGIERQVSEEIKGEFEKVYNGNKDRVDDKIARKLINDVAVREETVFIRKLLESDMDIAYSSDAHRAWEIPARKHMAQILLEAWGREVIDQEEFLSQESKEREKTNV